MLFNFGSGPARLPQEVYEEASSAILSYKNSGLSILEIPHRGSLFAEILEEADQLAKSLLELGDEYSILWLQGGGRLQFGMVPMNFLSPEGTAGYIDSGHWASDAIKHARLYGNVDIVASSKTDKYRYIPEVGQIDGGLSYL